MSPEFSIPTPLIDQGYTSEKVPLHLALQCITGKDSQTITNAVNCVADRLNNQGLRPSITKGGVSALQQLLWQKILPARSQDVDIRVDGVGAADLFGIFKKLGPLPGNVPFWQAPIISQPGKYFIKMIGPNGERVEVSNSDPKAWSAIVPNPFARIANGNVWVPKATPVETSEGRWFGPNDINLAYDAIAILHHAAHNLLADGEQTGTAFAGNLYAGAVSEIVQTDREETARYLARKMLDVVDSYTSLSVLLASMLPEWMIDGLSREVLKELKELGFSGHGFSTVNLFLLESSYPMASLTLPKEIKHLLQLEKSSLKFNRKAAFAKTLERIVISTRDPDEKLPAQKRNSKNPTPQDIVSNLLLQVMNVSGEKKSPIGRNPHKIIFDTIRSAIMNERSVLIGTSTDGRRYVYWTTISDSSQIIEVYNDPTMGIQRIDTPPFKSAWNLKTVNELVFPNDFSTTAEMILAGLEIANILSRGPVPGSPRSRRFGLWMPENIWQAIPPERQLPFLDW